MACLVLAVYLGTGFFEDEARLVCRPETYKGLEANDLEEKLQMMDLNVERSPGSIRVTSKVPSRLYMCRFVVEGQSVEGNRLSFR